MIWLFFLFQVISSELGGFLCRLPKNVGYSCGVTTPHSAYYFDSDIRECIEFMFEGCGGNQNRFTSKDECMEGCKSLAACGKGMPLMDFAGNIKRCDGERVPCPGSHECVGSGMTSVCCQKADRICQSSVNPGSPCGVPPMTRFYFDSASKTCRPFAFSGCGGNENNFKSKGDCMMFCSTEIICPRGEPHADRYSISNIASCLEDKHCPRNYTCTGRAGKKGACCPSKEFVCGSPFENRNNCRKHSPELAWWFDHQKGECKKTEHSNCEEHFNSFANQEQCSDYCVGTCPNGLETHLNPRTSQPHLCDSVKNEGCPMGYECLKSSPYASICCRTHPICPSAESILLQDAEKLGEAVRCDANRDDSCPMDYSCQQAKNLEHICCTKPLSCPEGMDALRENGGRPRVCSVGVDGACPMDHMCVQGEGSSGSARHLCCKPRKKCVIPYVEPSKKRPQRCFPGDSSCPVSTDCLPALEDAANLTNAIDIMFFCCHTVNIFTCPDGSTPLLDEETGKPTSCAISNPMSCPFEHACTSMIDGSTACCQVPIQGCVEALVAADGSPTMCKGWDDNTCPAGKCQKAQDGNYYCCRDQPLLRLFHGIHTVPQIDGVAQRVREYLARSLGVHMRPKRRRLEYLRMLEVKRNKF